MMAFQRAKRPQVVTVVVLDWDDTVIGRVDVPRGADAQPILNEYIKTHLIHPELREGVDHASIDRVMTYRGKYPAEGPQGTHTVADGERYALTCKLDYAYLKGRLVQVAPPTEERDGEYVVYPQDPADPYPYLHGLAVVQDRNAPPWTTFGVGELGNYRRAKGPQGP